MTKRGLIAFLLAAFAFRAVADDSPPDHPSPDGLVLWLDASDAKSITMDPDGHVQKWADRTDNGIAATAEDRVSSQPLLIKDALNRKPAIRFSGGQALACDKALRESKGPVAIFVVAQATGAGSGEPQPLFEFDLKFNKQDDEPGNFRPVMLGASDKQHSATIYYGEAASVPIGAFVLGTEPWMTARYLQGDIAEVLIYNRPFLSAGERKLVTDYLHAKWKATVPLAPGEWTRVGELGPAPVRVHDDLPLSDQENKGGWVLDHKFSDDFKEGTLDLDRWHLAPTAPGDWKGRKPALFMPSNVTLTNGMLAITDRKGDVPEMAKYPGQGYAGYTTGLIETRERSGYGYYEIKARPMHSAFCSAFWMTDTGLADNGTEIDIFEIGANAPGHEFDDNMTAHVWGTPQEKKRHWAVGGLWKAPWKWGDDFHVYGFDWNKDELCWYVDGFLIHKLKNTNWQFPMRIVFDSEPMLKWFGKINDADLPSTFDVQYLRVWRQPTP